MKVAFLCSIALVACSASSASPDGGPCVGLATCARPGGPTPGAADQHCASAGPDGGALVNKVDIACDASPPADDGGGGDGGPQCFYAATMFGSEGDDDDCKYHVTWSSTAICEQPGSVTFTMKATRKTDGTALMGAAPYVEAFTTTTGDEDAASYCDDHSSHGSLCIGLLTEGPPGTYAGMIGFDRPGEWTLRFHFFASCTIDAPDAPHGHAAFHVTVP